MHRCTFNHGFAAWLLIPLGIAHALMARDQSTGRLDADPRANARLDAEPAPDDEGER